MSFRLSLDETASPEDLVIDVEGLRFLVDPRWRQYLDGLEIDLRAYYGRESLVAYNPTLGGGCP